MKGWSGSRASRYRRPGSLAVIGTYREGPAGGRGQLIRTLRVSAYSNYFTPLSGAGTLFELRMTRVSKAAKGTQLRWAAPPDNFTFIDAEPAVTQKPGNAASGSVTPLANRK